MTSIPVKITTTERGISAATDLAVAESTKPRETSEPIVPATNFSSALPKIAGRTGWGIASKLFQSVSQLTQVLTGEDTEERKSLEERRRVVQGVLLEIHPPENRIGKRPPKELEKDPFVQTLEQVDAEVASHIKILLKDPSEAPFSTAELKSLYGSPHLESFFQEYGEVREEILRNDPSYVRQKALEDGIERISQYEAEVETFAQTREALLNGEREADSELARAAQDYRDYLLSRKDVIELVREDLEAKLAGIEMDEETQALANEEYSADLGDGEGDEPREDAEKTPSPAILDARQKLALFNGLIEELELLEIDPGEELAISLEELEGIVRNVSAYEEEWVWNQVEGRLEAIEDLDAKHPKVKELRQAIEELGAKEEASPEDYQKVLAKAEEAALWTSVEERIRNYSEMHDSAGTTDGIIALGRGALKVLAYQYVKDSNVDIDGASAYLEMQTKYIDVHRMLTEGKYEEAKKRFVRLETSKEHALLLDGYKDSQRINQCTVTAAIVTASAATAGIATELIGGAATALGVTRGLNLLKFATNVTAFTVAERGYTSWVYDKSFFDPKLNAWENTQGLGWDIAMNAGMFAFLGGAFRIFEKHLLLPLAKARVLAKAGQAETKVSAELIQAEREILLNQLTTGIPLRLGRFSTELLAFGLWDAVAQNLELNRLRINEGKSLGLTFPTESLFSLQAWEDRFVFLLSLKAGGLLAAPIVKPMHGGLQRLFTKPHSGGYSVTLDETSESSTAGVISRKILNPEDYIPSLEGKEPIGSGGGMQAIEFGGDPRLIMLVPKGISWEGNNITLRDAKFYLPFLKETLAHYDNVAHLSYSDRPLAPRIEGILHDQAGNLIGFLMERVPGENLYDLIKAGKISPGQMKAIEVKLREQLSILHENGLAHGDPEFLNVMVEIGQNGEVLDARFIDFTRPRADKYDPTHGTPQYDLDVLAEEMEYFWKDRSDTSYEALDLSESDLISLSKEEEQYEDAPKRVVTSLMPRIRERYDLQRGIPPRAEKNPELLDKDPALLMGLNGWHNIPIKMKSDGFKIVGGEDFRLVLTQTEGGNFYLKAVKGEAHLLVQGEYHPIGNKGVLLKDGDLLRLGNQDFIWKNPNSKNLDVVVSDSLIDQDFDTRMGVQEFLIRHTRILGEKTRGAFLAKPEYFEDVHGFELRLNALQESFHELERMEGELVDGEFPAGEKHERTLQVEEKWEEVQILYEDLKESWYESQMLDYESAIAEAQSEISYLEFRVGKWMTDSFMAARDRLGENLDLDWEVIRTPPENLMKYAEDGYEGASVGELLSLRVKVSSPEMARELLSKLEAEGKAERKDQADLLLSLQEEYDRLSAPMLELQVDSESDFQRLEAMEKELEPIEAAVDRLQQIKFVKVHKPLRMDREQGFGSATLELSPVDDTSRIYVKIQFQIVEAPSLQRASGI